MAAPSPPEIAFLSNGLIPECRVRWEGDFREFYAFHLSIGDLALFFGDERHDLSGAWFWWGFPGHVTRFHSATGENAWVHRYLTFQGPLVTRWIAQGLFDAKPQLAVSQDDAARFDMLMAMARRTDPWGVRRATNLLEQILLELADQRAQPEAAVPWLDSVLDELSSHSAAPDYAALAARHGMSLTNLRAQFRRATGISPHEYFLQARLTHARTLLTDTDLPLKVIADRVGYGTCITSRASFVSAWESRLRPFAAAASAEE